jgi:hypothetical protein
MEAGGKTDSQTEFRIASTPTRGVLTERQSSLRLDLAGMAPGGIVLLKRAISRHLMRVRRSFIRSAGLFSGAKRS